MAGKEVFVDHYGVLGVEETASAEEVGRAYKKLARKLHPDKVKNRGKAAQEEAATKFHALKVSYDVLKDEKRRKRFDAKIQARVLQKQRFQQMNAEKRKMKEDLERREREAAEGRTPFSARQSAQGSDAVKRVRLNRIREENQRAMEAFLQKKRREAAARAEFAAARASASAEGEARTPSTPVRTAAEEAAEGAWRALEDGIGRRAVLAVGWDRQAGEDVDDVALAGYFRRYGQIRDVVTLPSGVEALVRFAEPSCAARASLDHHPEFRATLARELPPSLASAARQSERGERRERKRDRKEAKKLRKRERKERKRRRRERGSASDSDSGGEAAGDGGGASAGTGAGAGEGLSDGADVGASDLGAAPTPTVTRGADVPFLEYEADTLRAILGEAVHFAAVAAR